jgi:hypothetical protein
MLVSYSLLEALSTLAQDDSEYHAHVSVSAEEAGSLRDEWSILRRRLFDLPKPQEYESEAMRTWLTEELERLSKGPRKTGTSWDDLPKMEAELLPDGRIAYALARGELSIFAGAAKNLRPHSVGTDQLADSRAVGAGRENWMPILLPAHHREKSGGSFVSTSIHRLPT